MPNICFGIIITSSAPNYGYKLRFNISNQAGSTDGPTNTAKLSIDQLLNFEIYARSLKQGMIGANLLVNNAILNV